MSTSKQTIQKELRLSLDMQTLERDIRKMVQLMERQFKQLTTHNIIDSRQFSMASREINNLVEGYNTILKEVRTIAATEGTMDKAQLRQLGNIRELIKRLEESKDTINDMANGVDVSADKMKRMTHLTEEGHGKGVNDGIFAEQISHLGSSIKSAFNISKQEAINTIDSYAESNSVAKT